MRSFAFTTTNWALRLATKLIKADVRLHNVEVIRPDMAIIFVVNHFTRLETVLLPYQIYKHTGMEVWSLAAAELFAGRIGDYLRTMGTVSTQDPDRDTVIIRSLLKGDHPWMIFPEGQMIKDKKVLDPAGVYTVYNRGQRRPPHKGAAALALLSEFYRQKIHCIHDSPTKEGLDQIKERFQLENIEEVLRKKTFVIPVNVTYFPIRARENLVLRMARNLAKDLSERALEELSVEGTFISSDTDIDITLGEPIDMCEYLNRPKYAELMACGDDIHKLEADPKSLFADAAEELMQRYMREIYRLTRVNYDHVFATIIRFQGNRPFTERRYRNRIFLCVHEIKRRGLYNLHSLLEKTYRAIVYEDPSPKFNDFIELCLKEGVLRKEGNIYVRAPGFQPGKADFHAIRALETTQVIANEVEPLEGFVDLVRDIAQAPRKELSKRVRLIFFEEDYNLFEKDYTAFKTDDSHPMDVGRPFLMVPERYKAGVVLVHGYLAAPKEVRGMAEYLFNQGYAVYGVRLRGHGTSPEDLARTPWEEWYESLNRGYVIIKTLTDRIILGGFSTGGCLALMGAGLKGDKIESVFSINAPLRLRQYAARLAASVVSMNNLLKKMRAGKAEWDFVANNPENPHINYHRNPLAGVRELGRAMDAMEKQLPKIQVPTLIIQASKDPVVHPSSGPDIFNQVGTPLKELTVFERDRHGIINGPGAEDVFERVLHFLRWAQVRAEAAKSPFPADELSEADMMETAGLRQAREMA